MFSDHLILQGKRGVKRLDQWGPYAVIVNRRLYEGGQAHKYSVVNIEEQWVSNVYYSRETAAYEALTRYAR